MDKEEQILGLITAASEQQEAAEKAIEQLNTARGELHNALASQQNDFAEQHRGLITQYGDLFKNHLCELTERGNHWLDWKMLGVSIATIAGCCLVVLAGTTFYLNYLIDDIAAAQNKLAGIEANVKKLKAFDADLRPCEVKGAQRVCIRVMASWGGQGTHKDYFVIDSR